MLETKPPIPQDATNTTKQITEKVAQTKNENIMQGMTLQAKKQLRQQGKQLLLKGCYRMGASKYARLIDSGIKQFTPRQQAIIYLNCGICFQFLSENKRQNYIRSLQSMRNALIADNTYEKTYYRLIQLMRDNGHLQQVLTLVPLTIKNKQIQDLLKEVRQQYMNESDLGKIIEKYKNETLSLSNGKALCSRLSQSIGKIIYKNIDFCSEIRKMSFMNQVHQVSQQIQSVYELIGTNNIDFKNQESTQNTQIRTALMQSFKTSVQSAFVSCIQDKAKITTVDLLIEPMLKLYRGQLSKFLYRSFQFNNQQLKLSNDSKFLSNNQFATLTKRTFFFKSQFQLIKYVRLVDVNLELFGKSYCYLSNNYYQKHKNKILPQPNSKDSLQNGDQVLSKFIYSNSLNPIEIISAGSNTQTTPFQYKTVHGGNLAFLYRNLQIIDLNFLKDILEEQCSKISEVYATAIIHPVWMESLNQVLFSIDHLLNILLTLVQVYSHRQSKSMKSLVNELSSVSELSHLIYIYHWQVHAFNQRSHVMEDKIVPIPEIQPPFYHFSYKYEHLLNYFEKQNQNFIALYLIEKIIQFAQQGSPKKISTNKNEQSTKDSEQAQSFDCYKQRAIKISIKKAKTIENKIQELKKNKSPQPYAYKQMYLILVCMILKLDIKRKVQIDSSIIFREVFKDVVNDMALEVLLLILINSPTQLHKYLENEKDITNLVQNFMSKPLLEQLHPFRSLLNLIYILVCDFQNDQEMFFAKKLGVTQQEVHQVRKLQKQSMDKKEKQQLIKLKKKFKTYIASEWHQILSKMCKMLRVTLKMQPYCSSKLCKVIYTIAETNHSKLYSSQIIQFMLEARNIQDSTNSLQTNTKQTACRFFQIICKKCNAQIFEYKHIQGIVDSLLWCISNCEHELVYFESLLGLVNLSTMAVRIPIEQIEKCLYEQNSYIMHAGVCVMNNILIYSDELQEESEKNTKIKTRISDLVYKYIEFYRDQIINLEIQLPQTDYSHPKKIYNSLISLATVLKLDKLEELESWTHAIKYIKILQHNQASDLMFKLAIYHSMEKTLPRNWNQNLQPEMDNLKKIDPQKYLKIAQLI